ncbi:MAG TPA: PP2C family protein-serine/threonine phosphatase [Thermoanaerobaculia bacterium]|nr:PP2C family protein-serine/threonine phosphatase [Thermoanaerobaculia bacterium]
MPSRSDWKKLAAETVRGVGVGEVRGLYALEWRKAVRIFLAEHRDEIEAEPKRFRRSLKRANALLFGLMLRLTPARRLLFAAAFILTLLGIILPSDVEAARAEGFFFMVVSVVVLFVLLGLELVDKLHFRDELLMARDLQADLVPAALPETARWDLAGFNRVANTVGGDLYDFAPLPDGRLVVLFGDASGHGMAAGLLMVVTQSAFRTQIEGDPSPAAVAVALNRTLCRTGACRTSGSRAFFSGVVMLLAPDGAWSAVVAGHPPVLRLTPEGRVAERIGTGAYPFGVREKGEWTTFEGTLGLGETLLFYSDGLPEARNAAGEEFGDGRVEAVAAKALATPSLLVASLSDELRRFLGAEPPEDDVSIAAIRRRMPAS